MLDTPDPAARSASLAVPAPDLELVRDPAPPSMTTAVTADNGVVDLGTGPSVITIDNGITVKTWNRNEILGLIQNPAVTTSLRGVTEEQRSGPAEGSRIAVDGGTNGWVRVEGWDQNEIEVRARVHAASAEQDGSTSATPERTPWAVSYTLFVPRASNLALKTVNGRLAVIGIRGEIDLQAANGSITLDGVGGAVRARTTNGSIDVELDGDGWDGEGLNVETVNGEVRVQLPEAYRADLETGTVTGQLRVEFPIVARGELNHRSTRTALNGGGSLLRAVTTNGTVTVRRR